MPVSVQRDPQADDFRAQAIRHLMRIDAVAERLAHLAAFAVDGKAVRQQAPCTAGGRRACEAGQQRRMEPAAMLIRAFQIQVGRELQFVLWCEPRSTCQCVDAGIEPHVERVAVLFVQIRVVAEQFARIERLPSPRCRPARRASAPLPRAAPACADAARPFPCGRRTPSARPIGADATASSRDGSRSCVKSRRLPHDG